MIITLAGICDYFSNKILDDRPGSYTTIISDFVGKKCTNGKK
jgi:hypothetical protein